MCVVVIDKDKEMIPAYKRVSEKAVSEFKCISQYTDLEALLKIISSKRIRFRRIDLVNDLMEKARLGWNDTVDNDVAKTYIACFTHDLNESIPLWALYGKGDNGVILRFHLMDGGIFDLFNQNQPLFCNGSTDDSQIKCSSDSYLQSFHVSIDQYKMEYCSERDMTDPKMLVRNENPNKYNIVSFAAIQKKLPWEYEKEVRFRMVMTTSKKNQVYEEIRFNSIPENLDAKINFNVIQNIEVIFNPWASKAEIEKYKVRITENCHEAGFPSVKFTNSSLMGEIKSVNVCWKA